MQAAQADITKSASCLIPMLPTFAVAYLCEYTDARHTGQQLNAISHDNNCSSHDLLDGLQTEQRLKQELIKMQIT